MSAELRVIHLEKSFGAGMRPAIDDVSFTIAVGEIVVLLGPSGCGKTTTLRSVAGLERPTGGTIHIGGECVADPVRGHYILTQHRNLGMVFQSYAVWPHMTVEQNVAYPLKHRKVPREEAVRKVGEAIEIVGLSAYAKRPVVALSGGQMQRVALARSLVYRPRILLLDEPLSNLDAKLRLRLRDDLRSIIKDAGVTALYVTHDQSEAVVIGDRIGVMKDGKLRQITDPVTLYNSPADTFVAHFTGAGSLLRGRIAHVNGGLAKVELDGMAAAVLARAPTDCRPTEEVMVSIRPENVRLSSPTGSADGIRGRVSAVQYEGTQTAYSIRTGEQTLQGLELGTRPRFNLGDEVLCEVAEQGCWAFRPEAEPDRPAVH